MKDRKEMKKLVATLVAVGVLGGCANMNNAQQGQLIGVGLGTIAAHNLSKGHKDRGLALVVGAIAGGIIGQQVGAHLDARDREMYGQTMQHTLERAPDNSTGSWNNPNSGHSGTVVPTQTYQASNGNIAVSSRPVLLGVEKHSRVMDERAGSPMAVGRLVSEIPNGQSRNW